MTQCCQSVLHSLHGAQRKWQHMLLTSSCSPVWHVATPYMCCICMTMTSNVETDMATVIQSSAVINTMSRQFDCFLFLNECFTCMMISRFKDTDMATVIQSSAAMNTMSRQFNCVLFRNMCLTCVMISRNVGTDMTTVVQSSTQCLVNSSVFNFVICALPA